MNKNLEKKKRIHELMEKREILMDVKEMFKLSKSTHKKTPER